MGKTTFAVILAGMFIVTYIPRLLPLAALSRVKLPEGIRTWLGFVPAAVLAALVTPGILMPRNAIDLTPDNKYLIAALPTLLAAFKTKSLLWPVVVGIGSMLVVRLLVR